MAIVSNCFLAFLLICFNSVGLTLWVLSYMCDCMMAINIVAEFFVVYVDDRGVAYAQCKIVALKYMRRMFILDALSVLPLDYFLSSPLQHSTRTIALLRLNRLIGLVRVIRFLSESRLLVCVVNGLMKC